MSEKWLPGDQVRVRLPARDGLIGRRGRWQWFTGTVRAVDEPGARPGVRVDLDQRVNGAEDCYATHDELQRWEAGKVPDR